MGARLRAIACVQCPDRVLVLVDGVVDVLDLRASPTLVPVGSDRFVGFGRAQPVVVVLRGSSGELLARAATEGAPALSLGTSTPDFVRYQLASSADGRHIVAAFKPSSVRVGEVRIVMLDGGSAGATSTTVPLDVRSPAALSDWSICIDPEGGRYAFVRPSGTTLAVSSAPFGAQPGPATQVPIDASSRLQGCGFVGDRVLVYGGAAGGPDQFALVAVRDGKVVGSVFPPDVSVGALGSAAVCDASGVVVVQGGLGTRTIDGETLRVATRPAVLTSGCTPRGEAYFLGSGGLVWQ